VARAAFFVAFIFLATFRLGFCYRKIRYYHRLKNKLDSPNCIDAKEKFVYLCRKHYNDFFCIPDMLFFGVLMAGSAMGLAAIIGGQITFLLYVILDILLLFSTMLYFCLSIAFLLIAPREMHIL
jgi:hypothetical protein